MPRFLILITTLMLSACSSIPVSTMLSMATFGEEEFIAINPDIVQSRITLDAPFIADADNTKIEVMINQPEGELILPFKLKVIGQQRLPAQGGWLNKRPARNQFLLTLTDQAKASFVDLQQRVKQQGTDGIGLNINARISVPDGTDAPPVMIHMTIELKLDPQQGFFTLFEDVELDMSKQKQSL